MKELLINNYLSHIRNRYRANYTFNEEENTEFVNTLDQIIKEGYKKEADEIWFSEYSNKRDKIISQIKPIIDSWTIWTEINRKEKIKELREEILEYDRSFEIRKEIAKLIINSDKFKPLNEDEKLEVIMKVGTLLGKIL